MSKEQRAERHMKAGMDDMEHYMTSCSELVAENADLTAKLKIAHKEASQEHNRAENCWDALSKESKHHNETMEKLAEAEKRVAELEARIAEKRVAEAEVRIKELNAEVWDLKLTPLPKSDPTTAVVSEPVNFQAANAELKIERGESVPGKVGKV